MANCCTDCHEEDITVTCDDGQGRCQACATEADFCFSCGRAGELCFTDDEGTLPEEWSGACRYCVRAWWGTVETERYHSHLWDVER